MHHVSEMQSRSISPTKLHVARALESPKETKNALTCYFGIIKFLRSSTSGKRHTY